MEIQIMMMVVVLGAAVVTVGQQLAVVPGEENTGHTCNNCASFSHDCTDCDAGRCCSPAHYCGSTGAYCIPCATYICNCYPEYCEPGGLTQKREDTISSKPRYNNNDNGTDHNTIIATYDRNFISTASSLTSHDNMLLAWRSNYGRATICGFTTALKHHDEGQCLKVTSSENGKQAVVRIVQNQYCTNPNFVLDYDVFQQLHNNGGNAQQDDHQLLVSYVYVHCMDY